MADRRRPQLTAPLTALTTLARRPRPNGLAPEPTTRLELPGRAPKVIDNAVYSNGKRVATAESPAESRTLLQLADGFTDSRLAWLGLYRPEPRQVGELAELFDLPELAVEDAIHAHQRPKFERYGETLFVVLKAARYLDAREEVEFGELHLFLGRDFVITIRHAESPDLARVRRRLESDPELLAKGSESVLYAILDAVVDGYLPVLAGLDKDIDEIELEVFRGDPRVSRRIYELSQEVLDVQRATAPLSGICAAIAAGFEKYGVDEELRAYLRDVADHVTGINERVDAFRSQLRDILTVNATLVAQRQNEEMKTLSEASIAQGEEVKKISAWAAILFAPSLIGGVYGMNFEHIPETKWLYGYPFALGLMFATSFVLYVIFKRRDWI